MPSRRGSLTIAGSGIATIGQLTLQTVAAIENADVVCYVLNDPAAEAFTVRKKNPNVYDMHELYDDGKPRLETYVQMTDAMLSKVRRGQDVVGLFYGHPGVFVQPSHRAIKIAREEGYPAKMLPGISAELASSLSSASILPSMEPRPTRRPTDPRPPIKPSE